jgi:hypothetical protein
MLTYKTSYLHIICLYCSQGYTVLLVDFPSINRTTPSEEAVYDTMSAELIAMML